jgi:Arc/MetJ-type ribon-helix-helix transcriptional regulator
MARGKPNIPKSVRLPEHQLMYIQELKNLGVFGTKESDIVRTLIQRAIDQLNQSRYIENHFKDLDLLKNRGSE